MLWCVLVPVPAAGCAAVSRHASNDGLRMQRRFVRHGMLLLNQALTDEDPYNTPSIHVTCCNILWDSTSWNHEWLSKKHYQPHQKEITDRTMRWSSLIANLQPFCLKSRSCAPKRRHLSPKFSETTHSRCPSGFVPWVFQCFLMAGLWCKNIKMGYRDEMNYL